MRAARRRSRTEVGSELIELALVIPILLLVCAAIVDFGFLFRSWETVTNAAREGARVGSLPSYQDADVVDRVELYMAAAGITQIPVTNVSSQPLVTTAGTMTVRSVTVTMTHDFLILKGFAAFFGGNLGTVPLTARADAYRGTGGTVGDGSSTL